MACGSGCCGPPAAAPSETTPATEQATSSIQVVVQDVEDGGIGCTTIDQGTKESDVVDSADDDNRSRSGEKDCFPSTPPLDDCCAPKAAKFANDGCCGSVSETPPPPDDGRPPTCCAGKPSPCCDQSCLDRLALRECENSDASSDASLHRSTPKCGRGKDGGPCADHSRKARLTYGERLAALGCICRALVALGQESCCSPRRRSSVKSARRPSKEARSRSFSSAELCCVGTSATATGCSSSKQHLSVKKRSAGGTASKDVCAKATTTKAASCADACCAEEPAGAVNKLIDVAVNVPPAADLERGPSTNKTEHVILSISGMTCTGCETKLVRTLGTHAAVKNLKTSLVLSRAEFDLVGAASVAEVMKHLERTTEFTCERVTNQGSNIDLIAPGGDAAAFIGRHWPDGVTEMRVVDKKTVNVSFDAQVIGARDLAERGWEDGPRPLAPPRPDPTLAAGSKHVRHVGYMTLLSACLTVPVLVLAWAPLPEHDVAYGSASLTLATLVQFVIAGPFYPKALKSLVFARIIEMDLLVVLSTSAAYIFSVVSFGFMISGRPLSTGEFFETSTLLVTLIMVGRWVGALARQKAVESISIRSLQTSTAILARENDETEIDARLLQYGDVFRVAPDSRIPTDGTVISGSSEVDESMMTGESKPVEKRAGSSVIAGSVNGPGTLLVRLTRLPGDNTISAIAGLVDQAKLSKPRIRQIADRVARHFVPVVVALTIITTVIWIVVGVAVRRQPGSEATIQAVTYAITVLIVSCPCAIGLAVPMVIVIASGVAAERGVVFTSAESIEEAYKTSHVVLDKTGTITEGKLAVAREWYSGDGHDQDVTRAMLLGLVGSIKHPVSAAVASHLRAQGVSVSPVTDAKSLTGKGVEGTTKDTGLLLQAGNSRWLNLGSNPEVQSALSQGYTAFCFTVTGSVAAVYGLEDSLRPDAAATVQTLLERGISVHIISGDDDGAVRSVSNQLNIPETNVRSRCTPADKQAYIQSLQTPVPGKNKKPVVMFCGDGTNDAVALAQATIGIGIAANGTDVAKSAADVVLMRPSLGGILTIIAVSKKSIRRIAFNFGWSFVYNLFAILLAAGAFVDVRIPPEYAGLGELVSVLPVIAAAVLLRRSRFEV